MVEVRFSAMCARVCWKMSRKDTKVAPLQSMLSMAKCMHFFRVSLEVAVGIIANDIWNRNLALALAVGRKTETLLRLAMGSKGVE